MRMKRGDLVMANQVYRAGQNLYFHGMGDQYYAAYDAARVFVREHELKLMEKYGTK
jgi:hypothetical protein